MVFDAYVNCVDVSATSFIAGNDEYCYMQRDYYVKEEREVKMVVSELTRLKRVNEFVLVIISKNAEKGVGKWASTGFHEVEGDVEAEVK